MFKTKGFSSNNSLKRRAIIVDAPDLPPEECEFFITGAGIADTDKVEISDIQDSPVLNFEVETLYEEDGGESESPSESVFLTDVKGIGKGTAENLKAQGVNNISDLLTVNPDELSSTMSGVSSKMVNEWKKSAKALVNT